MPIPPASLPCVAARSPGRAAAPALDWREPSGGAEPQPLRSAQPSLANLASWATPPPRAHWPSGEAGGRPLARGADSAEGRGGRGRPPSPPLPAPKVGWSAQCTAPQNHAHCQGAGLWRGSPLSPGPLPSPSPRLHGRFPERRRRRMLLGWGGAGRGRAGWLAAEGSPREISAALPNAAGPEEEGGGRGKPPPSAGASRRHLLSTSPAPARSPQDDSGPGGMGELSAGTHSPLAAAAAAPVLGLCGSPRHGCCLPPPPPPTTETSARWR